jgi:hypothetical protein
MIVLLDRKALEPPLVQGPGGRRVMMGSRRCVCVTVNDGTGANGGILQMDGGLLRAVRKSSCPIAKSFSARSDAGVIFPIEPMTAATLKAGGGAFC